MLNWLKKLGFIVLAILIVSICVNLFLGPHYIASGGLTGLAIILEDLFSVDRSIIVLIGNFLVLVLTFFLLGRETFLNTVIGALLLPLFLGFVPHHMLIADPVLSMILGSILFGVAIAILYANHASSGGTAVPPLIFEKYFNLNTSIGLFLTDGIVVLLSLFVFSVRSFFFAIFSILITSLTMRGIELLCNRFTKSDKSDHA